MSLTHKTNEISVQIQESIFHCPKVHGIFTNKNLGRQRWGHWFAIRSDVRSLDLKVKFKSLVKSHLISWRISKDVYIQRLEITSVISIEIDNDFGKI